MEENFILGNKINGSIVKIQRNETKKKKKKNHFNMSPTIDMGAHFRKNRRLMIIDPISVSGRVAQVGSPLYS